MRVPRIHVPEPIAGDSHTLTGMALQHVAKVLRLGAGAAVILFDGTGCEWRAVLESVERDAVHARLLEKLPVDREPPLRWELVQGISRGERMDYTLQKAAELGVAAIHPVTTLRSMVKLHGERTDKRREHWRDVAVSACEQCGRTRIPEVSTISALEDFLAARPDGLLLILDPEGVANLADLPVERPERVLLLAGPEGGFDDRERKAIYAAGARGLRLGPRILRTETAALVAAALLLGRWGDLA